MKKINLILFCLIFLLTACAGRAPTPERTDKIIKRHFAKYGKKYSDTDYHKNSVKEVEIVETDEIKKDLIQTTAFITLEDGSLKKILMIIERGPFGWRYKSWETLVQ